MGIKGINLSAEERELRILVNGFGLGQIHEDAYMQYGERIKMALLTFVLVA